MRNKIVFLTIIIFILVLAISCKSGNKSTTPGAGGGDTNGINGDGNGGGGGGDTNGGGGGGDTNGGGSGDTNGGGGGDTNGGGGGIIIPTLASRVGTYTNNDVTMQLTASQTGGDLKVTRNNNLLGLASIVVGSTYHLSSDTNSINTAFTNGSIPLLGTTTFTFDDTITPAGLTMKSSAVLGILGSSVKLYKQ